MAKDKGTDRVISWRDFVYPLCTIMFILTFVFFAPLESIHTDKGDIKCSILEILKLKGSYGTAEALIYFVVGWILAIILDRTFAQKFLQLFSKENKTARMKAKREYKEEKAKSKKDDDDEDDDDDGTI